MTPTALYLLWAAAVPAGQASVRATMVMPSQAGESVDVRVSVERQEGDKAAGVVRQLVVRPGARATELDLEPGRYVLRAVAAGFWSPDKTIEVKAAAAVSAVVRLWPLNDIAFRLSAPAAEEPPDELALIFRGTSSEEEATRVPRASTTCRVLPQRVLCQVPAARLDLNVRAAGFIPEYFWDVDNRPGRSNALALPLAKGSSVAGYVHDSKGQPPSDARVELMTAGGVEIRDPRERGKPGRAATKAAAPGRPDQVLQVRTNPRGFFQIRPAPGEYRLVAMGAGGESTQTIVGLRPGEETWLRDVLSLEKPYALNVTIEPPTHPELGSWTIDLVRLAPFSTVMRYSADDSGRALLDRVGRGVYNIVVLAQGEKLFLDSFTIEDQQPGPLTIKIPLIAVKGKARLGDNPLSGTMVFGGRHGRVEIPMDSDEEGNFAGTLPNGGDWRVTVESTEPFVRRTLSRVAVEPDGSGVANVEIHLDDSKLRGRVVDQKGNARQAGLDILPHGSADIPASVRTDPNGLFALRGLPPGVLDIQAHTPDYLQSDTIPVTVGETETEVTLVVSELRELRGKILSAGTRQPVASAFLYAIPDDQPLIAVSPVRVGPDGRFQARLPPHTVSATVAYSAEGHAAAITRLRVDGSEAELLVPTVGGELAIERPAGDETPGRVPVVVHNGIAVEPSLLERVGRRPGERNASPATRWLVPSVVPGRYALCMMDAASYRSGRTSWNVTGECSTGTVTPGGRLSLSGPRGDGAGKK